MKIIIFFLLISASALAQGINIPDPVLRNALSMPGVAIGIGGNFITVDENNDGQISLAEAAIVYELRLNSKNISSLQGLQHFHNLHQLNAMMNFNMGAVDMTGFVNLETLQIGLSGVTSINVTGLTNLRVLDLYGNNLATLDVSTLTNLDFLDTYDNHNLSGINFGAITNVKQLLIGNNPITTLDIHNFPQLVQLECVDTDITELDLSHCPLLNFIVIDNNPLLTSINLRNIDTDNYSYAGNSVLGNVCADAPKVEEYQMYFSDIGQTVNVNSNCALSIDEVAAAQVVMYPNPSVDYVTISVGSPIQTVEIYSLDGKLVAFQKAGTDSVQLNVSHLPTAPYLVNVITEKGKGSLKLIRH